MKSVLITGASSGIGEQLARDYAADGWHVYACGRRTEPLLALAESGQVSPLTFDTSNNRDIHQQTAAIAELDLVILNAGTCEYINDAKHFDANLFKRVIDTNLIGMANCLEALLPKLRPGGQLALMSSSVTRLALPRAEAYGASKAGIDYLARSLALDLAQHRISVSLIQPCFVDTPLTRRNKFRMPGLVDVNKASTIIRQGLARRRSTIAFTRLFIASLHLLRLLPMRWLMRHQTQPPRTHS